MAQVELYTPTLIYNFSEFELHGTSCGTVVKPRRPSGGDRSSSAVKVFYHLVLHRYSTYRSWSKENVQRLRILPWRAGTSPFFACCHHHASCPTRGPTSSHSWLGWMLLGLSYAYEPRQGGWNSAWRPTSIPETGAYTFRHIVRRCVASNRHIRSLLRNNTSSSTGTMQTKPGCNGALRADDADREIRTAHLLRVRRTNERVAEVQLVQEYVVCDLLQVSHGDWLRRVPSGLRWR